MYLPIHRALVRPSTFIHDHDHWIFCMLMVRRESWVPRHQMSTSKVPTVHKSQIYVTMGFLILCSGSSTSGAIANVNPPKPAAATGLVSGVLEGQDEDGDDGKEGDDVRCDLKGIDSKATLVDTIDLVLIGEGKTKKKRKNTKKKKKEQTALPRVALANVIPSKYPEGEIVEYAIHDETLRRTTSAELRHQDAVKNMDDEFLNNYRKAAEVHRQVRQYVQTIAKPGVTMSKLADEIEEGVRALTGHQGLETGDALKAGMGFPTGLCLNNVGAHWTPNPGGKEIVLQYDDVLKVDFGVHVNGRIVDSAFTVAANPVYDNLLAAVKAATNTGLKVSLLNCKYLYISLVIAGSWHRCQD
jgi:methionyl aminopeptidase